MTTLVRTASTAHWYRPDGIPVHEVPRADGKGIRPVHAGDAKKLGLLPSATNILTVIAKPVLDAWKQDNIVTAAVRTPQLGNESEEAWAQRIVDNAASAGTDFGHRLHTAIAGWLKDQRRVSDDLAPFVDAWADWYEHQGFEPLVVEQSFALPEEGYGGTIDHVALKGDQVWVLDWVSQKADDIQKLNPYPEKLVQAVAYSKSITRECDLHVAAVAVSSTQPGLIVMTECTDIERYWRSFCAARELWYGPCGRGAKLECYNRII